MLINILQVIFTVLSVYSDKYDPLCFWLPALVRESIGTEFYSITNMDQAYNFLSGPLSDFVFTDNDIYEGNARVNATMLSTNIYDSGEMDHRFWLPQPGACTPDGDIAINKT
jgi:hypothetical protein